MAEEKIEPTNEQITLAERVLRNLNDGHEPYAPSVFPMAREIAKLARDPAFVLGAAEALLRDAGVCKVDLPALTSAPVQCKGLSTGEWVSAPSLAEACAKAKASDPLEKLVAAGKGRGDG